MGNMTVARRERGKGDVYFAGQLMRLRRVRELTEKALEFLGQCIDNNDVPIDSRIASSRCLVQYGMWREDWEDKRAPETLFLAMFGNDPAKAAAWLDANEGRIRARLQQGSVATSSVDDHQENGHAEAEQGREGEGDEGR